MTMDVRYPAQVDAWTEFVRGIKRQSNVVMALMFKDFKSRQGRSRIGIVWAILGPMAQVAMIGIVWTLLGRSRFSGVNAFLFIIMGYIPFLCVRRCMSSIPGAIGSNQQLLNYPQVKPIDTLIARFIVEFTFIVVAVCLILFIAWWFFDLVPPMPDPLGFAYVIVVSLMLGFGIAMIFGVYGTLYESVGRITSLMGRPIVWISGVLHPITMFPNHILEILKWNPVLQLVEHARHYSLGTPLIAQADMTTPVIISIALLGIGILVYYANRFKLVYQ